MTIDNTIAALLTICILTVLWKENPLFRFAEHLTVGLAAAHSMVRTVDNYLRPTVKNEVIAEGQWYLIILLLFGALMYLRHAPGINWIARYPMSWFVGYGVGYTLAFTPKPFIKQIIDTFIPLTSVDNIIYFVITMITIGYFFFTPKDVYKRQVTGNIALGYLVENGKKVGRVKDCMFSLNVFNHLKTNLLALTKETKSLGGLILPYCLIGGVSISGRT